MIANVTNRPLYVVQHGWMSIFWREAVVDGENRISRGSEEFGAVGPDSHAAVAAGKSAAVNDDGDRMRAGAGRRVVIHGQLLAAHLAVSDDVSDELRAARRFTGFGSINSARVRFGS